MIEHMRALLLRIWPVSKMQFSQAHQGISAKLEKLLREQHKSNKREEGWKQEQAYILEKTQSFYQTVQEKNQILEQMMATVQELIQDRFQTMEQAYEQSGHIGQSIQNDIETLKEMCADVQSKEKTALSTIALLRKNIWLVDCRFDRTYYAEFPVYISSEFPDFHDEFLKLVNGLDQESIKTVTLGINRLKQIKTSANVFLDLYSKEEKEQWQAIFECMSSQILPLSESCYYWRGMMLPINHFEACVFYYRYGLAQLKHPDRLRKRDIIDAGAFIGDSALIFSPITECKVYSFEPVPSNYALMLKTIEMNSLENVVPCPYALGAEKGVVNLLIGDSHSTQFENPALEYHSTYDAQVITLDDYVQKYDLHVGLIKADIEGAEQLLLRGATKTIKSQKPALIISIYHSSDDYFHIKPMLEELNLGYTFKIQHFMSRGGSVMTETVLIAEAEAI